MRALVLTVVAALAVAACGSSGAAVTTNSTSFTITLDDYLIRPQELHVPEGKPLTVTVINRGRLGHTWRVRARTRTILAMGTIRPGERATRQFRLGPGRYTMFCALGNHEELGMQGRFGVGR